MKCSQSEIFRRGRNYPLRGILAVTLITSGRAPFSLGVPQIAFWHRQGAQTYAPASEGIASASAPAYCRDKMRRSECKTSIGLPKHGEYRDQG